MTSEASLHKLVKVAVAKRTSPKVFAVLLKQLLNNGPVSDNEVVESLLEIPTASDPDQVRLRVEYALEFSSVNALDLQRVMGLLAKLTFHSQRAYLVYLKNNYSQVFKLATLKEFINCGLITYTSALASLLREKPSLTTLESSVWTHTIFLWGDVIDHHADTIMPGKFKEMAVKVMQVKIGNSGLTAYFTRKANVPLNSADLAKELQSGIPALPDKSDKLTMPAVKKLYSINWHSKKGASYLKLKKFIWLNTQFTQWQIVNLVDRFLQLFSVPTHKLSDLIEEIIEAFVTGFAVAVQLEEPPFVKFNWKNYIVSQLPIFLKESKTILSLALSENLGELLAAAVAKHNQPAITKTQVGGFHDKPYDLRKQFLRSCIYKGLVTLETYTKTFPEEADSLSLSLITHEIEQLNHIDSLGSELDAKLLSVNTEFTSLEESKLVDFFQGLPKTNLLYLDRKQKQLNKLAHSAVDVLVKEKSHEKLGRLMTAMGNSLALSNFIFFNDARGPWGLLDKLITYTDRESFRVDDDDSNFQDTYSYFGTILSGIVSITAFFGVDLKSVDIVDSYTVNFTSRFFYRHCEDLTSKVSGENDDELTIVANYNNLLQDWVNALFDVNNDGLSDDLIKSINVKQTYKLISVIFQQAITANVMGLLTTSGLHNGVDYLSQNFLAPCSLEIMHWMCSRIGPLYPNSEAMVAILHRIIEINVGSTGGDPNYAFRVLLNVIGPEVTSKVKLVKNWQTIDTAAKTVATLQKETDAEYTQCGAANTPDIGSFSLADTVKQCLVRYVREPVSAVTALTTWMGVRGWVGKLAGVDLSRAMIAELERCLNVHANYVDSEEAKIFLDLLTFLVVASSGPLRTKPVAPGCSPAHTAGPHQFHLTIDNHFSSIFNEVSGSFGEPLAEKPVKDDLAAEFEMEDLFNDVGDDLFGDAVLHTLGRRPYSPPPDVGTIHARLAHSFSGLEQINHQLEHAPASHGRFGEIARLKLGQEVENWAHALKPQR